MLIQIFWIFFCLPIVLHVEIGNLSSAIRLFVFDHYRAQTPITSLDRSSSSMAMTARI